MIATERTVKFYTPDGRLYGLSGELPDGSIGIITAHTEEIVPTIDILVRKRQLTQKELDKALGL